MEECANRPRNVVAGECRTKITLKQFRQSGAFAFRVTFICSAFIEWSLSVRKKLYVELPRCLI